MDRFILIKVALIAVIALLNTLISLVLIDLIQGTWYQLKLTLEADSTDSERSGQTHRMDRGEAMAVWEIVTQII